MGEEATSKSFHVSRAYSYYVFSLLFLLYMFDFTDRMVLSSLLPYLKEDWGLSDTQCGSLQSIVTLSVVLFTFPVSVFIDRWSRKKSIGIMGVVWSFAAAACMVTANFKQLFLVRLVLGAGEAAYTPGGYAMIAAYFPEEKRATVNGLFSAAIPLGSALGIAAGGIIAAHLGWRYAFGLTALPGFIVAVLFFGVRDYKTVSIDEVDVRESRPSTVQRRARALAIARDLLRTRSLICAYFGFVGVMFVNTGLLSWLPTFFHRVEGLPIDQAGKKAALIFLLAVIGAPLGGILTDKWRVRRRNARMLVPAVSCFATTVLLFAAFQMPESTGRYGLLLAVGFVSPMFAAGATAVTQDVVHPGFRAISYSLCVIVTNLLGGSLSPIFIGVVSDRYDLLTAFQFLPVMTLASGVLFLIGSFFYEKDLQRVGDVKLEDEEGPD